jgi:hypothetical protein
MTHTRPALSDLPQGNPEPGTQADAILEAPGVLDSHEEKDD